MSGLEKISDILAKMRHDLRVSNAKAKLIKMERLKHALEAFEDIEIAQMFNIPVNKRYSSVITLNRLMADQEKHIKWLESGSREIVTTPKQDASINALYEAQRKDAEALGVLTFTGD